MDGRSGVRSRGGQRRFERNGGRAPTGPDSRRDRPWILDGARPGVGSGVSPGRWHHLPVGLRHANRQQRRSASAVKGAVF